MSYRVVSRVACVLVLVLAGAAAVWGQARPTITFENRAGEEALVRLVGPTALFQPVPDGTARTVAVRGGRYEIFVRYGTPGGYRYSRGEAFSVRESAEAVEHIAITLHAVVNGNYETEPSDEAEFTRGR
jgi:hypothetical protein